MENKKKFITRKVLVGKVPIGGNNPIRIQSMTNTKTEDVKSTVDQIIKLSDYGCEIARVTIQGKKQAYALEDIKNSLILKGCDIPLVADIHFYPPAAMIAADFVDKIRINPGNFEEKRAKFKSLDLTDNQYFDQIEKIKEKFIPLIEKLKKNKVALRIGINHGSLSDRIMTKYGNTTKAMVVSAVEYTKICRELDYHNIIFSMKSSNPFIMIQSYQDLVDEMIRLKWDYPLHLGVTEAGENIDGIIKSSVGIGSLLLDGIGDTIRVSLTEDPHFEMAPAKRLCTLLANRVETNTINKPPTKAFKPQFIAKPDNLEITGDKIDLIDIFYIKNKDDKFISKLQKLNKTILSNLDIENATKIYTIDKLLPKTKNFALKITSLKNLDRITIIKSSYIIFEPNSNYIDKARKLNQFLKKNKLNIPIILHLKYDDDLEDLKILAASEMGLILYEKLATAILIDSKFDDLNLSLHIFQACNLKRFKTEFISCPGCGRTLFDIQNTVKKIKAKTSHLPDIKIAVMGCIVNGPGEMQDSDFGYVGSATGKIDLYANSTCVEKNIAEKNALEKLISLIKKHSKWKEA